jgi:lambda family phage portal protein
MGFWDFFKRTKAQNPGYSDTTLHPYGYDGEQTIGGVGNSLNIDELDYWSLRERSAGLFYKNSYARGFIRRLVTNVINTGITPECTPDYETLGLNEDTMTEWAEDVETKFKSWGDSRQIIDIKSQRDWAEIQRTVYREALVGGDCVLIIRQQSRTKLPQLQIITGDRVKTPVDRTFSMSDGGNQIIDGVEVDTSGKHLAYYIEQDDGTSKRVAARGTRSLRTNAVMIYGIDKREDGVRGMPALGIAIQALNDLDRYKHSAIRKAQINAMIVGFIKRNSHKPASNPINSAATKRGEGSIDSTAYDRDVNFAEMMSGVFMQRLQEGEEPQPFSTSGTDINLGEFESIIIRALAWGMEMPPSVAMLSNDKSFSASQADLNEWRYFLNKERQWLGVQLCNPVFEEWFLSELLLGEIEADGFIESYTDPQGFRIRRAWLNAEWYGGVKLNADLGKIQKYYDWLLDNGLITYERACRELTNSKFNKNVKRLNKELEALMAAKQPKRDAIAATTQAATGSENATD